MIHQLKSTITVHNKELITQKDFELIKNLYKERCIFCEPDDKKVIFESPNFWVTLDSSPLVEGHLLIHSKSHIGCTGEVPNYLFHELEELKNSVGQIIKNI